jgi:hypothetical protein
MEVHPQAGHFTNVAHNIGRAKAALRETPCRITTAGHLRELPGCKDVLTGVRGVWQCEVCWAWC